MKRKKKNQGEEIDANIGDGLVEGVSDGKMVPLVYLDGLRRFGNGALLLALGGLSTASFTNCESFFEPTQRTDFLPMP